MLATRSSSASNKICRGLSRKKRRDFEMRKKHTVTAHALTPSHLANFSKREVKSLLKVFKLKDSNISGDSYDIYEDAHFFSNDTAVPYRGLLCHLRRFKTTKWHSTITRNRCDIYEEDAHLGEMLSHSVDIHGVSRMCKTSCGRPTAAMLLCTNILSLPSCTQRKAICSLATIEMTAGFGCLWLLESDSFSKNVNRNGCHCDQ